MDWRVGWAKRKRRAEDKFQRCGPSFALADDFPGEYIGQGVVGKTKVSARRIACFVTVRNYNDQKQPGRKGLIWLMVPKRLSPLGAGNASQQKDTGKGQP